MPNADLEKDSGALDIFRRRKVMTVGQIAELLKRSLPTVRRRLKRWGSYTSYNWNGRWYTLADVPKFDKYGLWRYKGVFFSKHGNLKKTVIHFINSSGCGLTAVETGKILGIPIRGFLSQYRDVIQSEREELGGRYVYFSSEEGVSERQKEKRRELEEQKTLGKLSTDVEAVMILVERIRNPDLDIDGLCAKLRRKGHSIKAEAVRNLFEHHGIPKKTQDTNW